MKKRDLRRHNNVLTCLFPWNSAFSIRYDTDFFSFAVKSTLLAVDEMASGSRSFVISLKAHEALLFTFLK